MTKERSKNAKRIEDRLIDELIGISRGVIADEEVAESEAIFMGQWIETHREIADKWPVNVLYVRIQEFLKDGKLDVAEQAELLETLKEFTGGGISLVEPTKSTTRQNDLQQIIVPCCPAQYQMAGSCTIHCRVLSILLQWLEYLRQA